MKLYKKKDACCGCSACADICPAHAVRMVPDGEGFCYPKIDRTLCVECGKCVQVCPLKNQTEEKKGRMYFGAQVKDDEQRGAGSSGGIFGLLAQHILVRNGIVYGAGYDRHMRVLHRGVADQVRLETIRKTKYVQSDMSGVYCSIEKDLKDNRWVLFCGTPCQARALTLYLNKEYDRLILMDLVCYGVPSPGIWGDYVRYLERKHGGVMTDFCFRDKRNADNGHMRSYVIDGREYVDSLYHDFFCKMYFKNRTLRPSCHSCGFCTTERSSDFTIGDFWGIEHVRPDVDDGMGNSMLIVHTDKAAKLWEEIRQETRWFACTREDLLQPRLTGPTSMAEDRRKFMLFYKILPFSMLMKVFAR